MARLLENDANTHVRPGGNKSEPLLHLCRSRGELKEPGVRHALPARLQVRPQPRAYWLGDRALEEERWLESGVTISGRTLTVGRAEGVVGEGS
jgi:hypothetical protein